jgi:hypothetical protein
MHKAASRKISFFLTGFILLAWVAMVPPSLCRAGMHELSDGELSSVYAYGFSEFTLNGDIATLNFSGVTLSTWTEIQSMKMGYYTKDIPNPLPPPVTISSTAWDNDWTNVSLGTSGTDLVANGLYLEAGFSNIGSSATRQLEYVRIGTPNLTGAISANFNSFSGTLDNGVTTFTRDATFGAATITATPGTGFNLTLSRNGVGNQMGYSFNWVSATKSP